MLKNVNSPDTAMCFATVRLECRDAAGKGSVGKAFFYRHHVREGVEVLFLVTNRHVIAGGAAGSARMHVANADGSGPSGLFYDLHIGHPFEKRWIGHPDPDVDLCAVNASPVLNQLSQGGRPLFYRSLHTSNSPSAATLGGLCAVEDILMVGYPIGLSDAQNNMPLVRRGITASHPAVPFEGKKVGVTDMACFPGSSGSPIVIYNPVAYRANGGVAIDERFLFLGVHFASPLMKQDGTFEFVGTPTTIPKVAADLVPVTPLRIHLGLYVPSGEVKVLGDHIANLQGIV